jgi:D-3-phosphoglycerate dehydrogenase / 2-oxoglutarate reductase
VVTPHLGASTKEAQVAVAVDIANQIGDYLSGGAPRNALNLPRLGEDETREMAPYVELSEKLGSFGFQAQRSACKRLSVKLYGQFPPRSREMLASAVITGVLKAQLDRPVNAVNATLLAKERGLNVESSISTASAGGYERAVEIKLESDSGTLRLLGVVFGQQEGRLVAFNTIKLEAEITGNLLLIENQDEPGVIGRIGTTLGQHSINIARMHLGLDASTGIAVSVVNIGKKASAEVVSELQNINCIHSVRTIFI